ncbi:arpA protein [Nocardia cyriacigeorgica]|uniref:ArpA protein n=1 Tax=Nocardia cyriacigeorgica TaxID=135487 RepID=A0A6P1CKZ9_9NOCA|nr:arpA protein [Nocardia cyriacigeorgica]MBF6288286.1 arpA protein [Nocardia cyriacigeorgica]MBF6423385.1 arpA protein [Nocardia cyriacigeorgica]NEW32592.1 arpA protein [Nocardia cyriacigeorgica]
MAATVALDEIVDTTRFPITEPDSAGWRAAVAAARADLAQDGCTVLREFIRPELHERLREQGEQMAPHAHYQVERVNAYNIPLDTELPEDHPGRIVLERGNAFVPRDRIATDALIHQLYTSQLFQRFIADCFELPGLHEFADPLAGLVLNVVAPGMSHPWHFDTNEYTVSMLTQAPESGGVFEYCPGIRSPHAENLDDVRAVLTGSGEHLIQRIELRPGDLQLFQGRYSLHRVSPVSGRTQRHTAIFAYSDRPGVIGTVERTRQLFGRVLSDHHAAADAVRGDRLLD